jgi:predicted SAM-dependent methyltransferase
LFERFRKQRRDSSPVRLHLGCGPNAMSGWINIDNQKYPGVDRILDLRKGLPFENVSFIYAEHFIEHLALTDGLALMRECRRVLRDDGVLRLSTPNLDWVWSTHYHLPASEEQTATDCFRINRAFRGWGHQFLYNETTLRALLLQSGFASVTRHEYGESGFEELRGIERHEQSHDVPELRHILIVEASGRGGAAPSYIEEPMADFLRDVEVR